MDKELLAKVEECAKKYAKRELSMEETDQVVGGSVEKGPTPRTVYLNGQLIDEAGFNAIFINLTKTSGFAVANKVLYEMTSFSCNEMTAFGSSLDPLDLMDVILNKFWLAIDELL